MAVKTEREKERERPHSRLYNYSDSENRRSRSDTVPSRWAALADVADRVTYKLGWMVYKCLHGQAPDFLSELCMPVGRSSRWTTASPFSQPQLARRHKVPAEYVWSSCLCRGCARNLELTVGWTAKPGSHSATFRRNLNTFLFQQYLVHWAQLEALCDYALYKSTFTLHYSDRSVTTGETQTYVCD